MTNDGKDRDALRGLLGLFDEQGGLTASFDQVQSAITDGYTALSRQGAQEQVADGSPVVTDAMVEAAEAAVYKRHERGFLIKPLVDPIDMRVALAAGFAALASLPPQGVEPIICDVLTMEHSSGFPDYFTRIKVGDRSLTTYLSKIKGRCEYHAAEFDWLLNGSPKPYILDFKDDEPEGLADYLKSVSAPAQGVQEPVAWQRRLLPGPKVQNTNWHNISKEQLDFALETKGGVYGIPEVRCEVRPLYAAPQGSDAGWLSKGASDVLAERRRQVEQEGWTPEHDDAHDKGELARAAGLYALIAGADATDYRNARNNYVMTDYLAGVLRAYWPFKRSWFKPTNRRRDLEKAGALIIGEIDRIDRLSAVTPAKEGSK